MRPYQIFKPCLDLQIPARLGDRVSCRKNNNQQFFVVCVIGLESFIIETLAFALEDFFSSLI